MNLVGSVTHHTVKIVNPEEILGRNGLIARRLDAYEERQQQLEMADAVGDAIREKKHLVVEAGTGVGKSFGYLVPAILALESNQTAKDERKRRIVVSTHTISLQEQLIQKDIPLLNSVIPLEFSAVLAKGRGNYVSLRRIRQALKKSDSLFNSDEEIHQLQYLRQWAAKTTDGSRADLNRKIAPQVWDEVRSDNGNCMGRKCPTYKDCHYYAARKRLQNTDILIVNHALFFSDLALRRLGISILPDYDTVILDEAHTIPDVASDHLGLGVTLGQVEYTLNRLYNPKTNKGLLVHHNLADGQKWVMRCNVLANDLFGDILAWVANNNSSTARTLSTRVKKPGIVANPLSDVMTELAKLI